MGTEEVHTVGEIASDFDKLVFDLYAAMVLYDKWHDQEQFVRSHHVDLEVLTTAPAAGDLASGEVKLGDATGPNNRDEVFWSVDGNTVARVEADSTIT